jgi:hypothetical protein
MSGEYIFFRGKKLDKRYKDKYMGFNRFKRFIKLLKKQKIHYYCDSIKESELLNYSDVIAQIKF